MQLAAQQREEARLAAAVGADEADLLSGVDGQVGAVEQALGAARENEVGDAQHCDQLMRWSEGRDVRPARRVARWHFGPMGNELIDDAAGDPSIEILEQGEANVVGRVS